MPNLCNSGKPREAQPLPQHSGRLAMAAKAQGLNVFKITLTSPLDHRHDVIGLPNALSYPRFQSPVEHQPYTVVAAGTLQLAQRLEGVYKTTGTDASVPKEDLLAEVGRLRAKFPFMDAVGRAKGEATGWHFEGAPTAETAAVRTSGDRAPIDPSPFHRPEITHTPVLAVGQQLINAKDDTSLDPVLAAAFYRLVRRLPFGLRFANSKSQTSGKIDHFDVLLKYALVQGHFITLPASHQAGVDRVRQNAKGQILGCVKQQMDHIKT